MKKKPRVLFNASVVLAGLRSVEGGSSLLLDWAYKGKVEGVISEVIYSEVVRHIDKTRKAKEPALAFVRGLFEVVKSPDPGLVEKFYGVVRDPGDAHVFASAEEIGADFLVSLDKKHILSLQGKVAGLSIVSPGELIGVLRK